MTHPEDAEVRALVDAIFDAYGLDFRGYAFSSLKRRIVRHANREHIATVSELGEQVLTDPEAMERLFSELTIHVTSMFRDPGFFLAFRERVVPTLRTYPYVRIWVAGCSTGEEVYSLAILLHEENLHHRCRIYATDINDTVLARAKAGVYPLAAMQDYTRNYQKAGGNSAFAEYYTADSEFAVFRPALRENVVFAAHNLAGDASFNEFHGILCRNVMIYFDRTLQLHVHKLFHESLMTLGYLGLGKNETIRFSGCEVDYEAVPGGERLFRKVR